MPPRHATAPHPAHPTHTDAPVAPPRVAGAGWLVAMAVLVVLPFLGKAPAIDEEGYLWIAAHLDPLRPYDWTRVWAPYDGDAYAWAHPPLHLLWLAACGALTHIPWLARGIAGLPWIMLLAWSVATLARQVCHHPAVAAATWITSPIVLLGLHDTWMIDLPATALATFAVAAYREGLRDEETPWFIASGLALGLAIETKYSMAVLVPVFAVHMVRLGPRPALWAALALVVVGVEAPLWVIYGRPHPWEVWARRGEIAAGGVAARFVGVLVRAALLGLPLVLVRTSPHMPAIGLGLALVAVLAAHPAEMPVADAAVLVVLAGLGGALLVRGAQAMLSSPVRRRKGDRGDALLLGGWFCAVLVGVVVFHNYASARYLLPAGAPAALMLTRSGEEVPWGKLILQVSAGLMGVLALGLAVADLRFANAGATVAHDAAIAVSEAGGAPGRFAGEWSFRGALETAGWTRYRPDEVLAPGTWVVVADNESPGVVPLDNLEPIRRVESADHFPLRVVDLDHGIGLYAETLGALPFGLGRGPIEGATVFRVK
jgi:hypothetical protein